MRTIGSLIPLVTALAVAAPARAHVGAVVAKAVFYLPAPPIQSAGPNGGVNWSYTPAESDRHFRFAWQDGDTDPTGHFSFYYMERLVPINASVEQIDGRDKDGNPTGKSPLGTIVLGVDGREARNVYVSCACGSEDAAGLSLDGATGPLCADGGARWCDNEVDWDTRAVPDGVYWLYAVNTDPPYHLYNTSDAPIRVAHGARKPPIVIVVRPDGLGPGADRSYRGAVIASGFGKLSLDLAWGINEAADWDKPTHGFATGVPAVAGADGLVWFDWDVSALSPEVYFVAATVTDDGGLVTSSDSRYGLSVSHRADGGARDFTVSDDAHPTSDGGGASGHSGCSCALGTRDPSVCSTAAWLATIGIAIARSRRRRSWSLSGARQGAPRD